MSKKEKRIYNTLNLDSKSLQRGRFWNEIFTIALHFELKFYNVSDFRFKIFTTSQNINRKIFQRVRFGIKCLSTCRIREKNFKFKKSCFGYFYSVKTTYFAFLFFFETQYFEAKFTQLVRFWIEKEYNAWEFELIFLQCVRFWHRV